jgi:hypothetical protein
MDPSEDSPPVDRSTFRRTLVRVIIVQVVALALLWLVQARYGG